MPTMLTCIQTQTSLRYYGGARKTAYQLDLFVHKYALPTSTALHKKGQEFNAVSKWIKKALPSETRTLDALDIAALRRASTALGQWTECMRTHAAAVSGHSHRNFTASDPFATA